MRVANVAGRLSVIRDEGVIDVAERSGGRFSSDPQDVYDRWDEFLEWAGDTPDGPYSQLDPAALESPAPRPRQIFAVGMNYVDHVAEIGAQTPESPSIFTKFASSIAGAQTEVTLPVGGTTDWEVELVVVIGRRTSELSRENAWDHIAGLTVGQDLSERRLQTAANPPQFSLGKSYNGFAPMGPWLVTVDEVADPDDLELRCELNGQTVQSSRTSQLVFSVPELIERLSAVVTLYPGDVVFTGTPGGVGAGRKPPRFLAAGDELVSEIAGIGAITQRFV
jgi:2-keto-4-pentenoate hydratase/2-oxohepta-3-ene-1,7-dioic acid hydratase in catechol pathway